MRPYRLTLAVLAVVPLTACSDQSPTRPALRADAPLAARSTTNHTSDPTATWELPLADAGLSIKSDGKYSDGTYSLYANGTCGVSTSLLYSGSGDNTISFPYPKSKSCGRTWTVAYPDGYSETLAYAGGVQVLENATYSIPIGNTVLRHFRFGTNVRTLGDPTGGRCSQGLVFGPNGANPAPGSDSVMVTRVDASTWEVQSQPAPNDNAYCVDNGQLYEMQVHFVIVSSNPLP